ncbi:MAG: flippase-like domain-containing protein [Chloroflexi bacterium]|nr:flippase-like domain-containing protein [Chloroflexota bacterium]
MSEGGRPTPEKRRHPAHHDYRRDLPESGLEIVYDPPDIDEPPGAGDEVDTDQISLSRRLRNPRTIISIVVPLIIVALVARNLPGLQLEKLGPTIAAASPGLLLVAFLIHYSGFPLRGYRWHRLLRGAGANIGVRDATEILFISWLVNCVVPAKLGDVYRAYLLRLNFLVSLSRTFGTVFIERVFDLFAIALLGLAAGFWSFRDGLSNEVRIIFALGLVIIAALAVGLLLLRNFGRRTLERLPLPHRVLDFYDRFEEGVFSIRRGDVWRIGALTGLIWSTEAVRLMFVVAALGFDVNLGISGAFFVALAASLLTAIPLTPAGLGVVEAAIITILTVIYRVPVTEATAIALVDRGISVVSVIVLGGIAYLLSSKTKGGPRKPVGPAVS